MDTSEPLVRKRDVAAAQVRSGMRVTLQAGETARLTQALGGTYTVVVNGNMFRVEAKDADALGITPTESQGTPAIAAASAEGLERQGWDALRTCYDPEIPVNIVDLGLVYDCRVVAPPGGGGSRVDVKMTLTAPGCGMGPVIQQDVQNKLLSLANVDEVNVELVWEPAWNQAMLTDAAKLELGLL